MTRRNLSNLLQAMAGFAFAERDSRWLALTAVGFDISILELLLPLTCGASVHVADEEARISARSIARCIDDWRIDTLQATPSTFEMLRRDGWRARRPLALLCGGEALSEPLAEFLLGQGHVLFNVYGPTEATIWATCSAVVSARDPSIGGPLDNTRLYVCDPEGRAVPCGMAGELVLSGAQVARGYLNAPNAPAYGADPAGSGERAYRTGTASSTAAPAASTSSGASTIRSSCPATASSSARCVPRSRRRREPLHSASCERRPLTTSPASSDPGGRRLSTSPQSGRE